MGSGSIHFLLIEPTAPSLGPVRSMFSGIVTRGLSGRGEGERAFSVSQYLITYSLKWVFSRWGPGH